VLVIGASGGVGLFAVQIARHLGAVVTGVCSARSFELVRSLGAEQGIDYRTEDFTANGERYDVIFDVAGASSFGRCRASLTEDGRYLTLALSVGLLWRVVATSMTGGPRAKFAVVLPGQEQMAELRDLVEQGVIRPVVGSRFPLERIAEAHAESGSGRVQGSVVVTLHRSTVSSQARICWSSQPSAAMASTGCRSE
jgi:NADPH:quinone reductase-like Zn-dependent oxidoreductase